MSKKRPPPIRAKFHPGETRPQAGARLLLDSALQSAITLERLKPNVQGFPVEVGALAQELARQSECVNGGDLKRGEALLAEQAATLHALFHTLARRGLANMEAGYLDATDRYLRLAMKAQSQCRTTWEAIAEIKNPRPVAFIQQANVAHGPQQVNNHTRGESATTPTELNGGRHAMDRGGAPPAIGVDSGVATMGTVDGAANAQGEGALVAKPVPGSGTADAARACKATDFT